MIDDPNVVLPLATTYNERGVAGYTHAITNSEDQRKLNCFYEVSKNPMTGKGTLTLSKRPGITKQTGAGSTFGSADQTSYLIKEILPFPNSYLSGIGYTVINKTPGNIIRSSTGSANVTIISSGASYEPAFIDTTLVTNSVSSLAEEYIVVQLNHVTQRVFYLASQNIAVGPWKEISDGDFTGLFHVGKMEFLDGFATILTTNNIIWNSDSNSLANWTASSFITKQIKQDIPVGLARLSNKILAFGFETVEGFYNAGNTLGSPLGRIPQMHTEIGMVSTVQAAPIGTHYYCNIAGKLFFVGRYANNAGCGLFVFDGYNFDKISSNYIDKILTEKSDSIYSVSKVTFHGQIMVAICFTAASASTQISLMFSPDWKEWFEWTSTVFSPVNSGKYFLGVGSNANRIYSFTSSDNWQDDGTSYQFLTQFRLPSNGSTKKSMLMYGVDADTDTSANTISVDVSDDDCQSFYSLQPIDLTWERKVNFRGGSYTRRHVRLSATDARPKRIANFIARIE